MVSLVAPVQTVNPRHKINIYSTVLHGEKLPQKYVKVFLVVSKGYFVM